MEFLGVKPAGQAASAEDDLKVQSIIDGIHEELKRHGLVPFETSAIPEWAQQPMTKAVAAHAGPYFGLPYNEQLYQVGYRALKTQTMGDPLPRPLKGNYY
jgi:hypothetical protein